jgi:magnesium transporter
MRRHLHKTDDYQLDIFDDIFALVERFNSLAGLYQNVITDLIEAYISLNGHRLNQIMKVLTIVTVIFVPLTLLVGIYGMNFENMPELKSEHGYYILLSTMTGIAALLLYLFRRTRWL